jgi:hypothetical protein
MLLALAGAFAAALIVVYAHSFLPLFALVVAAAGNHLPNAAGHGWARRPGVPARGAAASHRARLGAEA